MKKIIAIVGNNADRSTNRQFLEFIQQRYQKGMTIELMEVKDFPLFDKPANKTLPAIVKEKVAKIEAADGVIISTPEYDHSPSAALTNALAWLSYGVYPLASKPVFITGASYGTLGTSRAQSQLVQILSAPELRASIMPGVEFLLGRSLQAFDEEGQLKDAEQIAQLDAIMADFLTYIDINSQLTEAIAANRQAAASFSWDQD